MRRSYWPILAAVAFLAAGALLTSSIDGKAHSPPVAGYDSGGLDLQASPEDTVVMVANVAIGVPHTLLDLREAQVGNTPRRPAMLRCATEVVGGCSQVILSHWRQRGT